MVQAFTENFNLITFINISLHFTLSHKIHVDLIQFQNLQILTPEIRSSKFPTLFISPKLTGGWEILAGILGFCLGQIVPAVII